MNTTQCPICGSQRPTKLTTECPVCSSRMFWSQYLRRGEILGLQIGMAIVAITLVLVIIALVIVQLFPGLFVHI